MSTDGETLYIVGKGISELEDTPDVIILGLQHRTSRIIRDMEDRMGWSNANLIKFKMERMEERVEG